jgi:hypothetical protein
MVITCLTFVGIKTDAYLHSISNNHNSLDGNSFVKSIKGELKVVTKFQDDESCGQDVLSKCNYTFTPNAMLQFGVVACNYLNLGFSKFVCMLGCPSF